FKRVIAIHEKNNDRADLAAVLCNMAILNDDQHKWEEAEDYYGKSLNIYNQIKPNDNRDPDIAFVQAGYGWNLVSQGRPCEAIPRLTASWEIRKNILHETDWHLAWTQSCLGESIANCPSAVDRQSDAEAMLVQSWQTLQRLNDPAPPQEAKKRA